MRLTWQFEQKVKRKGLMSKESVMETAAENLVFNLTQ